MLDREKYNIDWEQALRAKVTEAGHMMNDLETIYREYQGKVLGYLGRKVHSLAVAEDLCSEVFLKITAGLDQYDPEKASLSTWIYSITRNTLYDYFRTRHKLYPLDETLTTDEDLVEKLCNDDMLERLADALETLTPREREIIIRRYYCGEPQKDINRRLGVQKTYGYMLRNAALKKLKKFFEMQRKNF